ncbi:MAG TPA: FKBP-type peptidyl-prolyl cis-trans isomerase [Gammaproteobacteria bacterium]
MPHRIIHPNASPLLGPLALLIASLVPALGWGADAPQSPDPQELKTQSVPVRARGYNDDYAELNAQREGVISLPSGVQYEILKTGSGKHRKQPRASDSVTVHYRAMLANGVEFDNTYERGKPATLHLDEYLVPGLKEALLLMKVGDEWRVTIPARLGFSNGRMLRKRDLIYEITLLGVTAKTKPHNSRQAKQKN